jgi:hypothetical protein
VGLRRDRAGDVETVAQLQEVPVRRLALLVPVLAGLVLPAVALADPLAGPQRVVEQGVADTAATCRRDTPLTDEQCAAVPGSPPVSEQALTDYGTSSTHRALALQFALGNDVPFAHATWLGTHNSFNTTTRTPTLSGLDSNQQLSLTDQLRSDMRSLELDAHWFPSPWAGGAYAPVLCHARGEDEGHAGCTTEPLLVDGLSELATWLRANPGQVVLLYVEDHLESDAGYAAGAVALRSVLGDLLYAPGGTGCTPLPLDRTRADVLRAGKQVLVISGCHSGAGWDGAVFSGAERARYETGPAGYGDDGSCDPARDPALYDDHLLRVFEDSTALSATVDQGSNPLTAGKAAALQRCAVDITGFDQLLPGDPRLAASVWSWARSEPLATGGCAVQAADGWHAAPCSQLHAFACRKSTGWRVDPARTPYASASARCRDGQVGTPRYGYEAVQLAAAMRAAGVDTVWLGLTRDGAGWTAHDTAS